MNNMERIKKAREAIDYVRGGLPVQKFGVDRAQLAIAGDALDILEGAVAILIKRADKYELVTADKTIDSRIDILNTVEDIIYDESGHEQYNVIETCPHCDCTHYFRSDKYTTECPCGRSIELCSMCNHHEDCDWHEGEDGHGTCKCHGRWIDEVLEEDKKNEEEE